MDEHRAQEERFRRFLFWDVIVCGVSVVTLAINYVFLRSPFFLVISVEILLYMGLLAWAWRRAQQRDLNSAALAIAIGISIIALSVGVMVTAAASVAVLLAVLSVMLGLPYMNERTLKRLMIGVAMVSAAVGSVAMTGDGMMPVSGLPTWALASMLGVAVPATIALVFLLVLQYSSRLTDTISQVQATNVELQNLRRRVVNVQEKLRREVAHHLHGPVQNRLLVVSQWLKMAGAANGAGSAESAKSIDKAVKLVDDINEGDLRLILRRLHPSIIRISLFAALQSLGNQFQGSFPVNIIAAEEDESGFWQTGLPETLRLAIYRVTEEAMNNVLKHSTATKVDVTLRRHGSNGVSITVEDDGRGFDVGRTVPGLGMLTMEDYCGAEGGSLDISSDLGRGTTVSAVFPLAVVASGQADRQPEPPPAAPEPTDSRRVPSSTKTVVVVDDQPDFCGLVKDLLRPYADFDIVGEGHDGASARPLVERHAPEILLLDVELPDMHGIEVAREIRAEHPGVKVVMMSAYYERDFSGQAGFDYIPKVEFSVSRLREVTANVDAGVPVGSV